MGSVFEGGWIIHGYQHKGSLNMNDQYQYIEYKLKNKPFKNKGQSCHNKAKSPVFKCQRKSETNYQLKRHDPSSYLSDVKCHIL